MDSSKVLFHSRFTDFDISLFATGNDYYVYKKMGSHIMELDGERGTYFAVYAPNAEKLAVVGDFNAWDGSQHMLYSRWDGSGIWEGFVPGVDVGATYKYLILPRNNGRVRMKADPYGVSMEVPPLTGSIVRDISNYSWGDKEWMSTRATRHTIHSPVSVYELHFGSWKRKLEEEARSLTYTEMVDQLVPYITDMGYTHVEFMPLTEFPYEPSWGYQVSGYYAATSRYGKPEELMYLIDRLHQASIGVIMDWVPAHFPSDDFALATFDGSCVYEHPDRRKGYHPDWNTLIFNFGRPEVKCFLISNAFFWMEMYHIDGLRVDAVSSIVFLDYSRNEGEWEPNQYGGRENLEAIQFLQDFNTAVYSTFPGIMTIAEESTSYPMVSRPVFQGGLGFGMKWMMGWMHDTLDYFKREFIYRKFHQNDITFSMVYAFSENFMLALSHDEVVHGKSSMIGKMSGDEWQKFANLRTLYAYMYGHPGTKLSFMGNEFGPYKEWNFTWQLEWNLLEHAPHKGLQTLVKDLNQLYRSEKALYFHNFSSQGFEWVDAGDRANSILVYKRQAENGDPHLLVVCNLNVTPHEDYKIALDDKYDYELLLNTDDSLYYGSGYEVFKSYKSKKKEIHGRPYSIDVRIPPLGVLFLKQTNPKKVVAVKAKSNIKTIKKPSKK
jgi:1,4-alpha-glucan branching enzyme